MGTERRCRGVVGGVVNGGGGVAGALRGPGAVAGGDERFGNAGEGGAGIVRVREGREGDSLRGVRKDVVEGELGGVRGSGVEGDELGG